MTCHVGDLLLHAEMVVLLVSECPPGVFGADCQLKCDCQNNSTCDRVTGTCLCGPGYYGRQCEHCAYHLSYFWFFLTRVILNATKTMTMLFLLLVLSLSSWSLRSFLPAAVRLRKRGFLSPGNRPVCLSPGIPRRSLPQT